MFQEKVNGPSNRKTILALAVTTTLSLSATYSLNSHAGSPTHPFSYEADGSCYCTEFVAISDIATTMLPTPVGGQSVAQICERLGDGPGLILQNGEYNHPAYADAQCGNGLQSDAAAESCTLLDGEGATSCGTAGNTWDLQAAYATPLETTNTAENQTPTDNSTPTNTTTLPKLVSTHASRTSGNISEPAIAVSENTGDVRSIADQLRAFNNAVTSESDIATVTQTAASVTRPATPEIIAIVESSFRAEPPVVEQTLPAANVVSEPEASGYIIRDAQPGNSHESAIQLNIGQTYNSQDESPIISSATLEDNLTQEDILGFPELETTPVPGRINRQTGDISITSDNSALEYRQIIIIEQDGSARRMTQDEIARLPLATTEVVSTLPEVQTALQVITAAETEEPVTAAAIATPDSVTTAVDNPTTSSAPAELWRSNLDYQYIGLAPTGYDFGGTGVEVEASASNQMGFSVIGSAGVADEYSEASVGLGFNFAPFKHRTTDVVVNVGVEAGQFDLGITDLEDTGGFIGGYIRTRPIGRLELTGGGRYSSYFEGDSVFIASGALRITSKFNAYSKVEVGDNDQFSFGFRYFY